MRILRVCIVLTLLATASLSWGYPRTVLFEDFTSTTCGPCATSWAIVGPMIGDYSHEDLTVIAYHMGWPGPSDPWYLANPDENYDRRFYYGVNAIPDIFVGGIIEPNPFDYNSLTNAINGRLNDDTPLQMGLDCYFDGDQIQVTVSTLSDEDIDNAKLYIALAETFVHWDTPAPNGMTDFHFPMVKMEPDGNGQFFSATAGEEQDFDATFDFNDDWDITNLTVMAFVQDLGTDEIYQSVNSEVNIEIPMLVYSGHRFNDEGQWRMNGRPDAGETVQLIVELEDLELYLPAENISGVLSCDDETITIEDADAIWPNIQPGETAENEGNPFVITIPDPYDPQYVTFTLDITADDLQRSVEFEALIGVPDILFINVVMDGEEDYIDSWQTVFDNAGFVPDIIYPDSTETDLMQYDKIILATGTTGREDSPLGEDGWNAVSGFLDNGGKLLLTSQYAGDWEYDETYLETYFAVQHDQDAIDAPAAYGADGMVGGTFPDDQLLFIGPGGAGNSESPSTMIPLEGAVPIFTYLDVDDVAGVVYDAGDYRTVFLGFPLEAVTGSSGTATADEILNGLLEWLDEPYYAVDESAEIALPTELRLDGYPNPFNSTLTVSFDLPRTSNVHIEVLNLLGRRVALLESGSFNAGTHRATWNAGSQSSGIYLVRMTTPQGTRTMKTMLLK